MSPFARGVWLCLLSQVLFGVLYLFSHWMAPVSGTDVFALRVMVMLALGLAVLGVAHEVWVTSSFSWTTLWVCLLFPPYYLSRRVMRIPALPGLTLDLCLTAPPMLLYLLAHAQTLVLISESSRYWLLLPALGLVSAAGMGAHLRAGLLLPFGLFALLSYTEPVLLFLAAVLVLDAPVSEGAWFTYGPIWAALMLLGWDGFRQWRRSRQVMALVVPQVREPVTGEVVAG